MKARKPQILPDHAPPVIWSQTPEVALFFNAMSAAIPYIEHYLNNVINEVRRNHTSADPELRAELDTFIHQETEHSKMHNRFNQHLFAAGFEELKPLLKKITQEMQGIRQRHSLAFNTAYCAGFENSATFTAEFMLGPGIKWFDGADPSGANLILWHVAEEFEHRAVCHRAFEAVSGSYALRIWGLAYAFVHVNWSFKRAGDIVFRIYRKDMTKSQRKQSKRAFRRFLIHMLGYMVPRMIRLLDPRFDPAALAVPPAMEEALAYFDAPGPIAENFSSRLIAQAA